jgi:hypothetical protein
MTVRLTREKTDNIKSFCSEIRDRKFVTIRSFAKLIGLLVASEPGIPPYAPFYYKPLEKIKIKNLNWKKGKFDAFMRIDGNIREILTW